MASPRTLFERLERPDEPKHRADGDEVVLTLASVQRHLAILLNSRRGFAPASPEYGLSDLADARSSVNSIDDIVEDVQNQIERFEPRLRDIRVTLLPNRASHFILHFEIKARLLIAGELISARFRSSIARSGAYVIESEH